MAKILVVLLVVLVTLMGTFIGLQYGQRLLRGVLNTSPTPKRTTLIDQNVNLKIQGFGGGYSWKMILNSGDKLTIDTQSNNTISNVHSFTVTTCSLEWF